MRIVQSMNLASDPKSKSPLPTRLARRLVSPQLFDFWATRLNPLWTLERPMARLVARTAASRDAVTLVLQPNGHWQGLQAGQHVSLGVEIDGRRLLRSYSPTVLAVGRLAITVKAIEGGLVSRYLASDAAIGTVVSLEPAFGDMLLPTIPTPCCCWPPARASPRCARCCRPPRRRACRWMWTCCTGCASATKPVLSKNSKRWRPRIRACACVC